MACNGWFGGDDKGVILFLQGCGFGWAMLKIFF